MLTAALDSRPPLGRRPSKALRPAGTVQPLRRAPVPAVAIAAAARTAASTAALLRAADAMRRPPLLPAASTGAPS